MEYLVKINTIATFNLAQLCALKMIKLKNRKKIGGAIVNMSSQMGHVGGPIRSVYNMTKWGLEGLTKGMSLDLAKYNIRVNTVCPTFVVTPMTKKFLENKKNSFGYQFISIQSTPYIEKFAGFWILRDIELIS